MKFYESSDKTLGRNMTVSFEMVEMPKRGGWIGYFKI